jgi:hypothetical protein
MATFKSVGNIAAQRTRNRSKNPLTTHHEIVILLFADKNMLKLLKQTTIAVAVIVIPASLVHAAPHHGKRHYAAKTALDIGIIPSVTTGGASSKSSSFPNINISDPANVDTLGGLAVRGDRTELGRAERSAFKLNQIDAPVPEPATWMMIGVGAILLAGVQRFRRKY